MFWSQEKNEGISRIREGAPESLQKQAPRKALPPSLQQLVDRDDEVYDELYSSYSVNTTETPYRYAGYASRIRSLWLSYHRYVAYASEVGEAHRPVAPQWLVRSAYAVSWAYVLGDVAHEGYKAFLRNRRAVIPPGEAYKDARDLEPAHVLKGMATANIGGSLTEEETQQEQQADVDDPLIPWATKRIPLNDDYRMVMAQRMAFHSIATIGLPALTIHSVVRYSGRALRDARSSLIRRWVPIGLGLSVVPFLPYLFDKPVEEAMDWGFGNLCRAIGGPDAVSPSPSASEKPKTRSTPLSSLLKLRAEEKRREQEQATLDGEAPSFEEYIEAKRRAREQRKQQRGSWFGFWSKEKDE